MEPEVEGYCSRETDLTMMSEELFRGISPYIGGNGLSTSSTCRHEEQEGYESSILCASKSTSTGFSSDLVSTAVAGCQLPTTIEAALLMLVTRRKRNRANLSPS